MIDILNWFRSIMNSGSVLGYFFQAVPITCIVGIIYVIIRVVIVKRNRLKVEWLQEMMKLLFTCYLTGLISLVVLPANFWLYFFGGVFLGWWEEMFPIFSFGGFNLVPSLIKALSGEFTIGSWVRTMLIGNIVMFLPLGLFLPFVTGRVNRKNIFVVSIAIPLVAELLQMVFGRSFDVDDLICNFIGIVVGFFIGFAVRNVKQESAAK